MSIRKVLWLLVVMSLACGESQIPFRRWLTVACRLMRKVFSLIGENPPIRNEEVAQAIMALPTEMEVSVSGLESPVYVPRTEAAFPTSLPKTRRI